MGLLHKLISQFSALPPAPSGSITPVQAQPNTPPAPLQPRPKSLSDLEQEMESPVLPTRPYRKQKSATPAKRFPFRKAVGLAVVLGIPIGVLWVVNLPYPPIRRPIARSAPMLLLPSYINMDHNYRQAVARIEEAKQLIDRATAAADLDLGAEKVKQAQTHLDALPTWIWDEMLWTNHMWWYGWHLTPGGINGARADIGRLQAKVFQEKNAQAALEVAEQSLTTAKQQYQQTQSPADQQTAIALWQGALDQLEQIPPETLAGKTAQQKLTAYQRDFQSVVGLIAGNEQSTTLIKSARQFAWQASRQALNPPHSVAEWQEIQKLWENAIDRLERVPISDAEGYLEAQKFLAQYKSNLGQVEVRKQAEGNSVAALESAKDQISALQATAPTNSKAQNVSQLLRIIDQLKKVSNGTTAYPEAQELLTSAQNKLNQLK